MEGASHMAESARAEVEKISTDRNNPMYAGYHSGHKPVMDYVQGLYEKSAGTAPIHIGAEGINTGDIAEQARRSAPPAAEPSAQPAPPALTDQIGSQEMSPEQQHAEQAAAETRLRNELGEEYDAVMQYVGPGVQDLFPGPEGAKRFREATQGASDRGPEGEALVTRFFSDWGKLSITQKGTGS